MDADEKLQLEYRRLRWHSRRGMLELDVLLLPFTEERYPELTEPDQQLYRQLIDCEDQDLFNWFMEKQKCPDPQLQRLVNMVLYHARNG